MVNKKQYNKKRISKVICLALATGVIAGSAVIEPMIPVFAVSSSSEQDNLAISQKICWRLQGESPWEAFEVDKLKIDTSNNKLVEIVNLLRDYNAKLLAENQITGAISSQFLTLNGNLRVKINKFLDNTPKFWWSAERENCYNKIKAIGIKLKQQSVNFSNAASQNSDLFTNARSVQEVLKSFSKDSGNNFVFDLKAEGLKLNKIHKEDIENHKKVSDYLFDLVNSGNYGEFNSNFGYLVKEDKKFLDEVQNSAKEKGFVYNSNASVDENFQTLSGLIFNLSKANLYRILFNECSNLECDSKKDILKEISSKIVESEQDNPSVLPSLAEFEVCTLEKGASTKKLKEILDKLQKRPVEFMGFDPYLLKQFLGGVVTSCKYLGVQVPKNIKVKLERLQAEEVFVIGNAKKLGGGKYNTVFLVEALYKGKEVKKVWKPVASNNPEVKTGVLSTTALSGISRNDTHAAYLDRSLLTDLLDKMLFLERGICSNTYSGNTTPGAISEKGSESISTSGILMDLAEGAPMVLRKLEIKLNDSDESRSKFNILKQNIEGFRSVNFSDFITDLNSCNFAEILPDGVTVNVTEDSVKFESEDGFTRGFTSEQAVECALEGSLMAGIEDYILGQTDRHYENYYVTNDGSLKLIDNDLCLGGKADSRSQTSFIMPNNASLLVNLPRVLTKDIVKRIDKFMFEGPKGSRGVDMFLENILEIFGENSDEYKKTVERIEKLKNHIAGIRILETASELLIPENLEFIDTETNYIARDLLVKRSDLSAIRVIDKKGWNPYRANRESRSLKLEDILRTES